MDDASPRLRWRFLRWSVAAVILLPVLYVAAEGPFAWRATHHYRRPPWYQAYEDTLAPLYQIPEFTAIAAPYRDWWESRPAPRSWRRQYLVEQIADRRWNLEYARNARAQLEAEAAELKKRLDALDALARTPGGVPPEAIVLRQRLDLVTSVLGDNGGPITPNSQGWLVRLEANVRQAEAELQAFDAQ